MRRLILAAVLFASSTALAHGDMDRDGINDAKDHCPRLAETRNGVYDSDGCPDSSRYHMTKTRVELHDTVKFQTDSDDLNPVSYAMLRDLAELFRNPDVTRIRIEGHTDSDGDASYNQQLSQRRAEAVRRYLIAEGVNPDKLTTVGLGETQPTASNSTERGKYRNRRVEFIVTTVD